MHTALLPVGKPGKQGEGFGGILEDVGVTDAFCGARRMLPRPVNAAHPRRRCRWKMPRPTLRIPRADLEPGKTGCQFSGKRISSQSIRRGNPYSALYQSLSEMRLSEVLL